METTSLLAGKFPRLARYEGDIVGGLVSAGVAIPLAMGYGMFAFTVLGNDYFPDGALAGLVTATILGFVCVALGDKSANVYAPRVTTTFFLGLLLYGLVNSSAAVLKSGGVAVVIPVLFAIILLAGVFQALFGLTRLGTLIRFIPQPVMSGFQNAAAVILVLVQLANLFGFDRSTTFTQALRDAPHARPLSLLIAAVAIAAMLLAGKRLLKVPALLVGLGAGTFLYYALGIAGLGSHLGPTIGSVPFNSFKLPNFPDFVALVQLPGILALLPTIVGGALALAVVASIDALLCAKLLARPGEAKIDGDRLLVRLGVANTLTAGFGGITGGFNIGPSRNNKAFGGQTRVSALVNAAALLFTLVVLFPLLSFLPCVALSAVIVVVAVEHFDPWTLRLAKRVGTRLASPKVVFDLAVILLVAVLSVVIDIVFAVFLGIAVAALLFLVRMSRSVIRRQYRCAGVRSRKSRTLPEMDALARSGSSILAVELQGALFFGSGERLAGEVAAHARQDTRYVILDLRRVTEIDSTGAQSLVEISADLAAHGQSLLVSVAHGSEAAQQLAESGVADALGTERLFPDLDRALEWAEDHLLRAGAIAPQEETEIPLGETSIAAGFTGADLAAAQKHFERREYAAGSEVVREGDPGDELFVIAKGSASARLRQPAGGDIRLVTFAQGTVFGELAILDSGPRSASVTSDAGMVCYVLSAGGFAALAEKSPAAAIKLVSNLGRLLSRRLREANRTILQLEG